MMEYDSNKPGRDVFKIIYPSGDRTQLCVADIWSYEEGEYAVASRQSFYDKNDAMEYCRELAKKHGLKVTGDKDNGFLD